MPVHASAMLRLLTILVCLGVACSFMAPVPVHLRTSGMKLRSSAAGPTFSAAVRRSNALRMSSGGPAPSLDNSDADAQEEEEEVPSTVLSDEDLEARISELGLGKEGGVEDKSTGETEQLTPIERAQKEAAKIGSTAIGGVASAAITALNAVEKPIDEEEWQKQQAAKSKPAEKASGERTMMDAGVLGVLVPVFLVGGGLGFWAIASENNWF